MCAPTADLRLEEAMDPAELRLLIQPSYALFEMEAPDPRAHQFRCCCNCCSCRLGAGVIAALESAYLVYQVAYSALVWQRGGSAHVTMLTVSIGGAVVAAIVIALALAALCSGHHRLLIPHLVAQGFAIAAFFIVSMLCLAAMSGGHPSLLSIINVTDVDQALFVSSRGALLSSIGPMDTRISDDLRPIIIIKFVLNFSMAILEIWWLVVMLRAYRFLKATSRYKGIIRGQKGVIGSRMANATAVIPSTNQYFYSANRSGPLHEASAKRLAATPMATPGHVVYTRTVVYPQ